MKEAFRRHDHHGNHDDATTDDGSTPDELCPVHRRTGYEPLDRQKVVAKAKTVLRIGNTVVDGDKVYRSYKVDQVNGDWLWLVSVSGLVGWVRSGDVVPFEQAIDYFTQEIHQNPSTRGRSSRED